MARGFGDVGDGQDGTGCHPAKGTTCGDDEADEQPTPTTPPIPGNTNGDGTVSDTEAEEASRKWLNFEIDTDEYHEILNRRDCAQGWVDACAALGR